jgi:hypothetical protein
MVKKLKKHLWYYFSLLILFLVGFAVTVLLSPNFNLQKITISATIVAYVFWGIFHHYKNHELTGRIMVEYILIGLLGLSVLFFVVEGGI